MSENERMNAIISVKKNCKYCQGKGTYVYKIPEGSPVFGGQNYFYRIKSLCSCVEILDASKN